METIQTKTNQELKPIQFDDSTLLLSLEEYASFQQMCVLEEFKTMIQEKLEREISLGDLDYEDLGYYVKMAEDNTIQTKLSQTLYEQLPRYIAYMEQVFVDYLDEYYEPEELGVDFEERESEGVDIVPDVSLDTRFRLKKITSKKAVISFQFQEYTLDLERFNTLKKEAFQNYCFDLVQTWMAYADYSCLIRLSKQEKIVSELIEPFLDALLYGPILDVEFFEPYFAEYDNQNKATFEEIVNDIFDEEMLIQISPKEKAEILNAFECLKEQLLEFKEEPWFNHIVEISKIIVSEYLDPKSCLYSPLVRQMLANNSEFLPFIVDQLPMDTYIESNDYWFDMLLVRAAMHCFALIDYVYIETEVSNDLFESFAKSSEEVPEHLEEWFKIYHEERGNNKELKISVGEDSGRVQLKLYDAATNELLPFEEVYYPAFTYDTENSIKKIPSIEGYWGVKYQGIWYGIYFLPMSLKTDAEMIPYSFRNDRTYREIFEEHYTNEMGYFLEESFENLLHFDALEYYANIQWEYDDEIDS